jgi:hypothetical protein
MMILKRSRPCMLTNPLRRVFFPLTFFPSMILKLNWLQDFTHFPFSLMQCN